MNPGTICVLGEIDETFGGIEVAQIRPEPVDCVPTAMNIVISFEEALKLHLSLCQASAKLKSYNSAVGSMETRVITQLEKIKEIGGTLTKDELTPMKSIDTAIRPVVKSLASGESED